MSNFKNCFAFDLGTSHFRIFHNEDEIIEVASEIEQEGIVYKDLIRKGAIAHFYACEILIRQILKKIQKPVFGFIYKQFTAIVSIPSDNNNVTIRSYRDIMEHAGSRETYMLNDCILTGVGLGLDITKTTFTIIDFGVEKTSISTVENKEIVNNVILDISFSTLTEQLQTHLSHNYNLIITDKYAEKLIIEYANLKSENLIERTIRIDGNRKNSIQTLSVSISNMELTECLKNEIELVIERVERHINNLNENTQFETLKNGVYVVGKPSRLKGFKELLNEKVKIATKSYSSPESYLKTGIETVLKNPTQYLEFMIR